MFSHVSLSCLSNVTTFAICILCFLYMAFLFVGVGFGFLFCLFVLVCLFGTGSLLSVLTDDVGLLVLKEKKRKKKNPI